MSHLVEFRVDGLNGKEGAFGHSLNRDINVFFGLNGSGKTSLLKIFHSAFNSDARILNDIPFRQAQATIHSEAFNTDYKYTTTRNEPKSSTKGKLTASKEIFADDEWIHWKNIAPVIRNQELPIGWKVEPQLKSDIGRWKHRYLPVSRLINIKKLSSSDEFDENSYDTIFAKELERHWNEFFGGVQAEVRAIQEEGIATILGEVLARPEKISNTTAIDWAEAYQKASDFIKRQKVNIKLPERRAFQAQFKDDPILQKVVQRIVFIEEQIAKVMQPRTKLQDLISRLFSGKKRVIFGDTKVEVLAGNNATINLQSLSAGEKHILRILFEVLRAENSTLIIDEPELSLHIDWQRELIKAIRELNPSLQLIVATHSPEIMAEIDDSKIFHIPA